MVASLVLGGFIVWQRCGWSGCPEIDGLREYMPAEASVIVDVHGKELGKLFLERRVMVTLSSLPEHVPNAFVAIEDQRFWDHGGVDWRRVFGAGWKNIKELGIEEGASTITMQLARNVFPENLPAGQKTAWRKLREARVAGKIEQRFSKHEILQLYLNQIYFGNGAYGIETAAQEYYGKPAAALTLAEAATLATVPRSPTRLNPRDNAALSRTGRQVVLRRMAEQQMITSQQADTAAVEELHLRQGRLKSLERAPYFVEMVRRVLEEQLGDAMYREGYTIHTTLDLGLQTLVEKELRDQLQQIEAGAYGVYRHPSYATAMRDTTSDESGTAYLQTAAVFVDPRTGDVRALVGGRNYADSEFNRATQALRQPGSAFKPFIYAAAVAAGYAPSQRLVDRPLRLMLSDGRTWQPENYDGSYAGAVTMRDALTYSRNVPTVRLGMEIGIGRVIDVARRMGMEGELTTSPSILLGAIETTPFVVTTAYATFAALGRHSRPRLITRVVNRSGAVVWSQEVSSTRAIEPGVAYTVNSMLKDVVDRGTGSAVRAAGFQGVAAGKTGTTNDATDVWFIGFTPRLVGTIWMGFDRRQTVLRGATGGELVAPVWGRVMRKFGQQTGDWAMPAGLERMPVHTVSLPPVADPSVTTQGDSALFNASWLARMRNRKPR